MKTRKTILFFGIMAMIPVLLTTICLAADTSQPEKHYAIKAQYLKTALGIYEDQSGQNIAYASKLVEDKTSNPINETCSPAQALQTILKGTGLQFKSTANGTLVLIQDASASQPNKYKSDIQTRDHRKHSNLKMPRMDMDDMVVTATKTPTRTKDVAASIVVQTEEDINLTPTTENLFDVLSYVSGVDHLKGGMGDNLYIRGMGASLLINGRDMNFLTIVPSGFMSGVGSVERVEVVKGPQAGIYGSNAVSGVINIIKKRGDKDHPFMEAGGFYGTSDKSNVHASIGGGFDKFSYFLDYSKAEKDKHKTPDGNIPNVTYESENFYARLDYQILEDHEISFDYSYDSSKDTRGGRDYWYLLPIYGSPDLTYVLEPEYNGGYLSYDGKINDHFSLFSNIGLGERKYRFVGSNGKDVYLNEEILQGEIKLTAHFLENDKLKIISGVQYKKTDLEKKETKKFMGSYTKDEKNISPYAQMEFKPNPYVLFVSGIRYDKYKADEDMSATSPNVGLSIFPFASTDHDWTNLWVSYSKGFRTPPIDLKYRMPERGGNPNLKPEKSKSWEVGLKQQIAKWANLEGSYFHSDYEDMIGGILIAPRKIKFVNTKEAEYKGYEINTNIFPTDWLIFHASFTKMTREDKKTGKKFTSMPEKTFKYGAVIPDYKNFYFSIFAKQYNDYNYRDGRALKKHPSSGTTIVDIKSGYRFYIKDNMLLEPFISIENATDKTYYDIDSFEFGLREGRTISGGAYFKMDF